MTKERTNMNEEKSNTPEFNPSRTLMGTGLAICLALGAGIGVALGNLATGIGAGAALGVGLGAALSRRQSQPGSDE
jgi:hypothetical protein